jgi:acyl-CoA synthetase (AMP-forming)/AMP-acid ligase II
MEEVLASHPDVAECAVIGVHDDTLKGQVPLGLLVLKHGVTQARRRSVVVSEVVKLVRDKIGPVAAFKTAPSSSTPPAQDALRQDPARHHAQDRRRRGLQHAGRRSTTRCSTWTAASRSAPIAAGAPGPDVGGI